jgi:hypothetical protein
VLGQYVGEQAHQQMKEELGLDHYEGRSWQGLHRRTLITMSPPCFAVGRIRRPEESWAILGLFAFVHGAGEWLDLTALVGW